MIEKLTWISGTLVKIANDVDRIAWATELIAILAFLYIGSKFAYVCISLVTNKE